MNGVCPGDKISHRNWWTDGPAISGSADALFAIDEDALAQNLRILGRVQAETGAKILLAQKAFSNFALYPMIGEVLAGTTASGLFEARLGHEEMGKETHIFLRLTGPRNLTRF